MLGSIRYFLSDVRHWLATHRVVSAMGLITLLAIGVAVYVAARDSGSQATVANAPAPAPNVVVKQVAVPKDTTDLGFPTFATKNTTRIAGADPTADAAGAALAVWPSTGELAGPDAVSLVDAGSWQAGIAAASLVAAPVGAPTLLTEAGELPPLSATALHALDPQGSDATAGRQVFVIGSAASPEGYQTLDVPGDSPAAVAAEVAKLRERLAGRPDHIVIASSDEPGYAMPAAAWAARSGDPVLFAGRGELPAATATALRRDDGVAVYVLGPEAAISKQTFKDIEHIAPGAQRVGAGGEAENSVAFARYTNGGFGWNINDPGHGFVLAKFEPPDGRRGRRTAVGERHLGTVARRSRGRRAPRRAARVPARPEAGLRGRSDPRRLQPRLADWRHVGALGRSPGRGRRSRRGRPGNVRLGNSRRPRFGRDRVRTGARTDQRPRRPFEMSESERPDRLSGREITVEDVRALAGPATPHFALQIRNRIQRLITALPQTHPARVEGERQVVRLTELAGHSGEPRGGFRASRRRRRPEPPSLASSSCSTPRSRRSPASAGSVGMATSTCWTPSWSRPAAPRT